MGAFGIMLEGRSQSKIQNIRFENIHMANSGGGEKILPVPEFPYYYPDIVRAYKNNVSTWGMFIRHVNDISFNNVYLWTLKNDARPDIYTEDVLNFDQGGYKPQVRPPVKPASAKDLDLSILRVRKIRRHAYFPDITEYKGSLFISYREACGHSDSASLGRVVILKSEDDGESWEDAAILWISGADLRDPHFCILSDGRLMLNGGIGGKKGKGSWKGKRRGTYVAFSEDGIHWSKPEEILDGRNEWMWRGTTHIDGYTYGIVKEQGEGRYRNIPEMQYSRLMRTTDGIHYELIAELQGKDIPNEATIRFAPDSTAYIVHRMDNYGLFGKSRSPYKEWTWNRIQKIGGPNLMLLPGGHWLVGGRAYYGLDTRTMQLGLLDTKSGSYTKLLDLPSGGDCSYPGFLIHRGKLWVVYYSSHEGSTNMYLAELSLPVG
jgi:hypothetical protein